MQHFHNPHLQYQNQPSSPTRIQPQYYPSQANIPVRQGGMYPQQYPQQPMPQYLQQPMPQYSQQDMYPQQFPQQPMQQYPQQPMGQYPQQPTMLPNGMVMLPNGTVVPASSLGMMQQQTPQQYPATQPPMNYYPNTSRFGSSNQVNNSIIGGISSAPQESFMPSDNRFSTPGANSMENTANVATPQPALYTITAKKEIKFQNNSKINLKTYMEEVNESQVYLGSDDSFVATDCFEEAIETIREIANKETNKPLALMKFIVNDKFYRCNDKDGIKAIITQENIKYIYKSLKEYYKNIESKYDFITLDSYNMMLTDFINEYLELDSENKATIDSFMVDFNDLLKFLRNNEEDTEERLLEALNKFVKDIAENIAIMDKTEEKDDVTFIVPRTIYMVYVDKLSVELGLEDAPSSYTEVEFNPLNKFLFSLFEVFKKKTQGNSVYLITLDGLIVKLTMNSNEKLFIKRA